MTDVARSIRDLVEGLFGKGGETLARETIVERLIALRERTGDLDKLERVALRHYAIEAVSRCGAAPGEATEFVRAALSEPTRVRTRSTAARDGTDLVLSDPEPWPGAVDGADLLDELVAAIRRFIVLPPGGAEAVALWVVHAHAHDACEVSPILTLSSPRMRCGKSTTFAIVGALVPRPVGASNISSAAVFRVVDRYVPTLLIDEADTFLRAREELVGILNSGHARPMARVIRTVGEGFEPKSFSTWAPKAIALIGTPPATLCDRSIVIRLQRKLPHEKVARLRLHRLAELEPLRRQAARFASDALDPLRAHDPEAPDTLDDRAADNWRPLLAIADLAGGRWPEAARRAAIALSGNTDESDSSAEDEALRDVFDLFVQAGEDRLRSATIVAHLARMSDRPWPQWHGPLPISEAQLATLLRPFKVKPRKIRFGATTAQGYLKQSLVDPVRRYAPSAVEQSEQANGHNNLHDPAGWNANPGMPSLTTGPTHWRPTLVPVVPPRGVNPSRWSVCHIPLAPRVPARRVPIYDETPTPSKVAEGVGGRGVAS